MIKNNSILIILTLILLIVGTTAILSEIVDYVYQMLVPVEQQLPIMPLFFSLKTSELLLN